ncbi:MAG: DUF3606 domain-containing protein, partial [Mesorhizobium sp.]
MRRERNPRADDKNKLGYQDRAGVSADEEYEIGYFASKFGLSTDQVRAWQHARGLG